uniref:Uncharacterized protein n=1 Tax=Anopheles atroparvus TaxID=41427 RepID=A0A182JJ66_ANOAO
MKLHPRCTATSISPLEMQGRASDVPSSPIWTASQTNFSTKKSFMSFTTTSLAPMRSAFSRAAAKSSVWPTSAMKQITSYCCSSSHFRMQLVSSPPDSSRRASSEMSVSENSRISTSISMYSSFSCSGDPRTSLAFSITSLSSWPSSEPVSSMMSSISLITSSAVLIGSLSACSPPRMSACMSRSLATASSSELRSCSSSSSGVPGLRIPSFSAGTCIWRAYVFDQSIGRMLPKLPGKRGGVYILIFSSTPFLAKENLLALVHDVLLRANLHRGQLLHRLLVVAEAFGDLFVERVDQILQAAGKRFRKVDVVLERAYFDVVVVVRGGAVVGIGRRFVTAHGVIPQQQVVVQLVQIVVLLLELLLLLLVLLLAVAVHGTERLFQIVQIQAVSDGDRLAIGAPAVRRLVLDRAPFVALLELCQWCLEFEFSHLISQVPHHFVLRKNYTLAEGS